MHLMMFVCFFFLVGGGKQIIGWWSQLSWVCKAIYNEFELLGIIYFFVFHDYAYFPYSPRAFADHPKPCLIFMLNVFRVASDFGWSQDYWVLARNCRTIFQPLSSFFLLTMIASVHLDSWLPKEFKKLSFMVHYHFTFFELQNVNL
jgi:hypothetical protein